MKPIPGVIGTGLAGLALLFGCGGSPAGGPSAAAPRDRTSAAAANAANAANVAAVRNGAGRPELQSAASPAPAVSASAAASDEVVARINGRPITMSQLRAPLVEAHGLPVLLNLVQLELARQEARRAGIELTPDDIAKERERTIARMFKEADQKTQDQIDEAEARKKPEEAQKLREQMRRDREQLLNQFLEQQRVTRPEFELVLQTNAHLRRIAEPQLEGKITDEQLQKAFETEYGGKVRVRHIQATPQELIQAKARIDAGEKFEDVAKEMSHFARTAALGGELPAFSLTDTRLPDNFKQAAFDLKVGEISNIVNAGDAYHLIKLEQKFAPKAVKFEDVKDILRERLYENAVQALVEQHRAALAEQARKNLVIDEPVLKDQFTRRMDERERQIKDQEKIREEMRKQREAEQRKATQPGSQIPEAGTTDAAPGTPAATEPAPATPKTPEAAPAAPKGADAGAPNPQPKAKPADAPAPPAE